MPGTKSGGVKAALTNKSKYGDDFYKNIGAAGGKKSHTGGFYANRELARTAGAQGGRISRRKPKEDTCKKIDEMVLKDEVLEPTEKWQPRWVRNLRAVFSRPNTEKR